MVTNKNWNILKKFWGENFLYGDNKIEFQNDFYDYEYLLNLRNIIENFEEEAEQNFLNFTNSETRDNYILTCYEEINTRIHLNGQYIKYIMQYEKINSEAIANLLRYQSDALFGLTLWFNMNLLFEKALKETSIVVREIKKNDTLPDIRIKGKLSKAEIEKYFMDAFSTKQKDQSPILLEEQIEHFLHANFIDFNPTKDVVKFETANTTQQKIRKIIHSFYLEHSPNTKTGAYIYLLKSNFSKFDNTSFSSEQSNFHK